MVPASWLDGHCPRLKAMPCYGLNRSMLQDHQVSNVIVNKIVSTTLPGTPLPSLFIDLLPDNRVWTRSC